MSDLAIFQYSEENNEFEIKVKLFQKYSKKTKIEAVKSEEQIRKKFVNKFNTNFIKQMTLEDYAIGRSSINDNGKASFCYAIEQNLIELGDMRGAYVSKFGIWYSIKYNKYTNTNKWGKNPEEALENIKQSIIDLIIAGKNKEYEKIKCNKISELFKGKILTTYFPSTYIGILNVDHIDYFLEKLGIYYDTKIYNNVELKKALLLKFKNENTYFKKINNNYFVIFLYEFYKEVLNQTEKSVDILYNNLEIQNYDYIKSHSIVKSTSLLPKKIDYKKVNINKEKIGKYGENAVFNFEKTKLEKMGRSDLSKRVEWSSQTNDALGYDIKSFDEYENEIHIEVKTTSQPEGYIDFYLTINELEKFELDPCHKIYYIFNIKSNKPKYHIIDRESLLERREEFLKPVLFKVSIDVEVKNK